jgi:hypothetical protein
MTYHNQEIKHIADLFRQFAMSIEMHGTPGVQVYADADAVVAAINDLAYKYGGPRDV